jgi:diguanylate cyclase (GGDEF)-like protein
MATCVVCAGVIYQRHQGAAYGFQVPSELVAVTLTGAAVMANLRTFHFVPGVILILVLSAWSEIDAFGASPQTYYVIQAQSMLGMIAMLGAGMEEYAVRAAWLQRKMLEELTLRDPLTGLVNARGLRDVYRRLFSNATREHRPMLVVAVDIDHFKAYNDHYGHLAGDDGLRRVANTLSRHGRRGNDISARTGGEEFVLVWYDVSPENAPRLLESMRQDIEQLGILHAAVPHRPSVLTISIGAVCAVPGPRVVPESLLRAADEQLYLSKQRGRNCVSLHIAAEPPEPGKPRPWNVPTAPS